MSTSLSHSGLQPAWKDEVNRRVEAHKSRKGFSVEDQSSSDQQPASSSRAAAAAARVAARYAKVPSFSEMQAAEARNAVRAAEAATRAAIEAQAAAQAVLDHFENNGSDDTFEDCFAENASKGFASQGTAASVPANMAASRSVETRWQPDMQAYPAQTERRSEGRQSWDLLNDLPSAPEAGGYGYKSVEAAQEIPANLIEFPREIVASRRMRPRITEVNPMETDPDQLSIFEVDPDTVSTQPMGSVSAGVEPSWIGSSWQEIELGEQPQAHALPDYYALQPDDAAKLYQAPFSRRMMATMVDTALIVGLVCGAAYLIASRFDHLPGIRVSEICGGIAILGFAALYEWFFLTFAKVTPGMRYAQLSLCTFNEEVPSAAQIKERLKAMVISVLPVGLGMLWSIFDEDQMSWHDRLSKTYLRLS